MPLMSQAGEVHGNASLAPTGFNGQLALAPVEHLTLLAGASTYTEEFDSNREALETANLPTYSLPSTAVYLEPTLMGRAGFNELKFQMMISRAVPINGSDFDYRRWNVSFGINLNFGKDFERYELSID